MRTKKGLNVQTYTTPAVLGAALQACYAQQVYPRTPSELLNIALSALIEGARASGVAVGFETEAEAAAFLVRSGFCLGQLSASQKRTAHRVRALKSLLGSSAVQKEPHTEDVDKVVEEVLQGLKKTKTEVEEVERRSA